MNNTTNIKIFVSVIGLLILGSIAGFMIQSHTDAQPGKYDTFAQALKDKGATFYGAFWCPHCKAEKALFGTSVKLLPYVECSAQNGVDQLQVCIDKKVETYPTWTFPDPIKFSNSAKPVTCTPEPETPGEDAICERVRSKYGATVWMFPEFEVSSTAQPVHTGNDWTFDQKVSQLRGEIPLATLAQQIGFTLPQ